MHELIAALPEDGRAAARYLNRECVCLTTDHQALQRALEAGGGLDYAALRQSHPHLFSDTVVFVSAACLTQMADFIAAMESVVALPAYQEAVLAWAPEIARYDPGHPGVFFGYDFHLDPAGPRLIEINTNAGGGLLNAYLARAQEAGGGLPAAWRCHPVGNSDPEAAFVAMFREEWRQARGEQALTRIAIVDAAPASQYLAPEFTLFQRLLGAAGIATCIADPAELVWDGARLCHASGPVDLVYNRLTDFALEAPAHGHLKAAYLAGAALLTPHPRAHALYADKRNLVLLSDPDWLAAAGVAPSVRERLLAAIPRTLLVTAACAEMFWQTRRQWFFKPAAGFGSRAAYRGDKLTKRVFEEILSGNYIAQALVPPPERRVVVGGALADLKFDLRNYAYRGQVQLVAARLYQGQTTNFRTPGGGFAAVLAVPEGKTSHALS